MATRAKNGGEKKKRLCELHCYSCLQCVEDKDMQRNDNNLEVRFPALSALKEKARVP